MTLSGKWVVAGLAVMNSSWGEVPFWRLFTLGGANSLRGYPLGHYLVTRRWELSGELQWYAIPMHIVELGSLGDQILGLSLSLFVDAGAGTGTRRGPVPGPWPDGTPTLMSGGLGCYLHNALLGTIRIEFAWPEYGPRQFIIGLGTKF
jgi:hemolysin activation/secretion protein